jgi:glucose dehydrogenase
MHLIKSSNNSTVLLRKKEASKGIDNNVEMKKRLKIGLGLLCLIMIFSCSKKAFETQKELLDYVQNEENGYFYKKTVVGVDYVLQYRPTDLLVQQELGDKGNPAQVEKLRQKYNKYLYFNLSMSKNNQELLNGVARDKAKFGQMVNELAFGMEEKVHLYTPEKDTLAMADFIYPRMYGMSNATSILIVYPRDTKFMSQDYLNFVIEDLGLDTGDIKFKLNTKALKNEPQLKF